jgi:branched-chain amino acid transport system ATP-binding protein
MTVVLSANNLIKSFGGVKAVDDVSFEVEAGRLLAMIGPNGAEKTTCFNLLNGRLPPGGGSAKLDGKELVGLTPRKIWRLGVGRTFQVTATFGSMTVLENVQMTLLSHYKQSVAMKTIVSDLFVDEAMALLERVGMAEQAKRACSILAYGDLKRVELAVALGNEPRLLLMDEPTAGTAPRERIELMQLTADIVRERNISVLFTEHDMDFVLVT